MANVSIGKITKPQGVKGEFRLRPNDYEYDHYVDIKTMKLGSQVYNVQHISLRNGFVVVKLQGINDRNTVEALVGTEIYADVADKELADNEYLIADILGASVVDSVTGHNLGMVVDISNYGATDVYTVENDGVNYMFPVARGVITSVDTKARIVYVNSEILDQIKSE